MRVSLSHPGLSAEASEKAEDVAVIPKLMDENVTSHL